MKNIRKSVFPSPVLLVSLASIVILVSTIITPVYAISPIMPFYRRFFQKGYFHISLYPKDETTEFSSSLPTFVAEGWVTGGEGLPHWSEMTRAQQIEFLSTASFTLLIDDEPINLHRYQYHQRYKELGIEDMLILYWAVFDPNHFTSGIHVFDCEWYVEFDGEPIKLINQVVITVTP